MNAVAKILAASALAAALAVPTGAVAATAAPAWSIQSLAAPTNVEPGDESGDASYQAFITNSGGAKTDGGEITIVDTLPPGIIVKGVELRAPRRSYENVGKAPTCVTEVSGEVSTVVCK